MHFFNNFYLFRNSLLDELPRDFLLNLIRAAVLAAQGPMKVLLLIKYCIKMLNLVLHGHFFRSDVMVYAH